MTDEEYRQLRQASDSMPSVDLAVISPSKPEQPPAIEQQPESSPVSETDAPLPSDAVDSLEIAAVADSQAEPLDTAQGPQNIAEPLDVVSAPATGEDRLTPPDAPVAESADTLEIPVAAASDSPSLPTTSPEVSSSEPLGTPDAPPAGDQPLALDTPSDGAAAALETGGDPATGQDTLEIPLAPSSQAESLPTESPSAFESGGDATIPQPPPASIDPELSNARAPQVTQDDLQIPLGPASSSSESLDAPTVQDQSREELPLGGPAQPSASPLGTGYVPLDPGRSDLWMYDDSQDPPLNPADDGMAVLQTGFESVRDRMLAELDRQLQEQAVLTTMRETDFG